MKIQAITGPQGSFMGRSVFQDGKKVPNTAAKELLLKFPTADQQKAEKIEVSVARYFKHIIVEGATDTLKESKANRGYFVFDADLKQWLYISRDFSLNRGELRSREDGKIYASSDEAERITAFAKSNGLSVTKELIANGLM